MPELLYNTILTVIDLHKDPSGAARSSWILGTHSTRDAAKSYALGSLQKLSFAPDDFKEYEVRTAQCSSADRWSHGDDTLIFACAPSGQVFLVGIEAMPNNASLSATSDGEVVLPEGVDSLNYVVQVVVDHNQDSFGSVPRAHVNGSYVHRADALLAARNCLDPAEFAEYDMQDDPDVVDQWPFGEDVVVHAISKTGQIQCVAVKRVPWVKMGARDLPEA
jgi:hypothetical protein